ncbi:MAG: HAD-IA family hydrolase [Acidimicrobiales bacterium]
MTISAIIFDFDGTILDTEWSQYESVSREFRRHGVEYDLELFRSYVGRADHPHWSELLQGLIGERHDIDEICERRMKAHHDLIEATDIRLGVVDLMNLADRNTLPLAVASSSPLEWVDGHLTRRNLRDRFVTVATRDRVANAKPWPDVFLLAAAELEISPSECLVIEDSTNGVTAAKAAGMTCVAVPNPITVGSDFSHADLVLDSLADFRAEAFGLVPI